MINIFQIPQINGVSIIQFQNNLLIITPINVVLYILLTQITYYERKFKLIPDKITLPGIVIGLILSAIFDSTHFINHFLGVIIGGLPLLALSLLYTVCTKQEGIGLGVIKLSAMIGSFIGVNNVLICLTITTIIAIPYGLIALSF